MFLFALTRAPLNTAALLLRAHEASTAGLYLTIATDSGIDRTIDGSNRWELFESVAPEMGSDSRLTLCRLRFDAASGIIEVSRPIMGGRPIYYHLNPAGDLFCSSHISLLRQAGIALHESITARA